MNKIVIFDFDGVIVDSFEHSLDTIQTLFPGTTREKYRDSYKGNVYENSKSYTDKSIDEIKKVYFPLYMKGLHKIVLFSKMDKIIQDLSKRYTLTMVSSCAIGIIDAVLKREGLQHCFDSIFDGYNFHTSKIKKFKNVFDKYNVTSKDCIFITDTIGDLVEAEKAGIECIAVSWGYHDSALLKQGKNKCIIDQPDKILEEVKKHFANITT